MFLYHAVRAGMDMGIVNAGQLEIYDEIAPALREAVEDVVLNGARMQRTVCWNWHRSSRVAAKQKKWMKPGGRNRWQNV